MCAPPMAPSRGATRSGYCSSALARAEWSTLERPETRALGGAAERSAIAGASGALRRSPYRARAGAYSLVACAVMKVSIWSNPSALGPSRLHPEPNEGRPRGTSDRCCSIRVVTQPQGFQPRLRDTLYLDTERARALLSQLTGGIVEEVIERRESQGSQRLGARVLGLEAGKDASTADSVEQSTTFVHALLSLFEEAAEESGLLTHVPLDDAASWLDGKVHTQLVAGQLVCVTAPTRILDAEHVGAEMLRALELINSVATLEELSNPTPLPPQTPPPPPSKHGKASKQQRIDPEDFKQAMISSRFEQTLGMSPEAALHVKGMFETILGSGVSVRIFPCGAENPELALAGRLTSADRFLRDEPETLFAKYGWDATDWTVIGQLATVPLRPEGAVEAAQTEGSEHHPASEPACEADEADGLNREQFEGLGIEMMNTLSEAGVVDAPRFPGLTITPIAIYRDVPVPSRTGADESV